MPKEKLTYKLGKIFGYIVFAPTALIYYIYTQIRNEIIWSYKLTTRKRGNQDD